MIPPSFGLAGFLFCTMIGDMLTPLKVVIALEMLGVAGMIFGPPAGEASFLPRETALFLLGIFAYFALFAPLKHAVLFAVFSIPLYTALPITAGFDTMAGWRIIIAILCARILLKRLSALFYSSFSAAQRQPPRLRLFCPSLPLGDHAKTALKSAIKQCRESFPAGLGILMVIFFVFAILSLRVAQEPTFGIRKLLFLANIFALFFIIQQIIRSKQDWLDVFKYTFASALFALAIGYAQFISVFFASLHNFWVWWVNHVIPVFYGVQLEHLLSYSNTWFSYYENAEPTLRVFSVFPDSHSFALAMVLLLAMALTYYIISAPPKAGRRWIYELITVLALLAIIFSGTRGVWVAALPVFFILILTYLCQEKKFQKNFPVITFLITRVVTSQLDKPRRKIINISILVFLVFALLFPVASQIQKISQWRQGGQVSDATTLSRISTSFSAGELSNKGRIQIWKSTLKSIAAHPFLGVGIGNYPVVLSENVSATKKGASAHSLYLDFAAEIGIFGGIIVFLILFEILRKVIRIFIESTDLFFTAFAGFFAIFLLWIMAYSVVDVVLLNDKVLLLFVTLVALLYAVPKVEASRS